MDSAQTGERAHGVLFCPPAPDLDPLGSTWEIAELFARTDEAAIHLARHEGSASPFDAQQHRLVEQREAVVGAAVRDVESGDALEALGLDIAVATRPSDVERFLA